MDEGIPERSVTQGKVKGAASFSLIFFNSIIKKNQLWFQFHTWIGRIENPNSKSHLVIVIKLGSSSCSSSKIQTHFGFLLIKTGQ